MAGGRKNFRPTHLTGGTVHMWTVRSAYARRLRPQIQTSKGLYVFRQLDVRLVHFLEDDRGAEVRLSGAYA